MAGPELVEDWTGEDVTLAEVEAQLARLRHETTVEGRQPNLRASVMSHVVWVPEEWLAKARSVLADMAERHPSRTIMLVPDPDARESRIDASASVECYSIPGVE